MRMEEMQSQLNTQLQTLQNSFKKIMTIIRISLFC